MSESASPITNGFGHTEDRSGSRLSNTPDGNLSGDQLSGEDADLFGDEDDASIDHPHRKLDDAELDSGDDEGRNDRLAATIEDDEDDDSRETKEINVLPATISRVNPPEADELYLLNMPPFLGLRQRCFDPATYETPTKPHDSDSTADFHSDPNFSAFSTASTSIHWRHDPRNPANLQSNSRIIRWSDGSLTLQIASSPKDQYRISTQSMRQSFGTKNQYHQQPSDYDPNKDAQVYLAAPHVEESIHQIVAPVDASLKIMATGDLADESVIKLQQSLAATMNVHDPLTALKQVKEDPELAKKAAEMFEKDRMRSTRRRELAEERLLTRKDRVLGRSGLSGRGGLSVAGLEDEDGMPTTSYGGRASGANSKNKKNKRRKTNRQGIIYSDDEEEGMPRGRTREDEYDEDDGFLVGSDEEPELFDSGDGGEEGGSEDPDEDDLMIEGRQTVVKGSTRGGERDRNRGTPDRREDVSGGGKGQGSPQAGRKKRRVIDDEDDE